MLNRTAWSFFIIVSATLYGCGKSAAEKNPSAEKTVKAEQVKVVVPTICVYTLGDVRASLLNAMMDSLRAHHPRCEVAGNMALPEEASTTKRHDHVRYRADALNKVLWQYKSDTTIVIGLTQSDIGLDNFRGREHSGIMGQASGIGTGVAVFSSYRPHGNGQLFSVILHEIGHAQGLRHCPDEHCIMQDAKGGNPFSKTSTFCAKCKAFMRSKNWRL